MVNEKTQEKAQYGAPKKAVKTQYGAQKNAKKNAIWCTKECRKKRDMAHEEINETCHGCCMRKCKKKVFWCKK